jgi:hypothetical protein
VSQPAVTHSHDSYVTDLLRLYLDLPDTPTRARAADRVLARSLSERRIPLELVHAAFALACARRRLNRATDATPLGQIRSLHYFLPVIEELRLANPNPAYLRHVEASLTSARSHRP